MLSEAVPTKGVDADVADAVTEESLDEAVAFVKKFAEETGTIIAVTGAIDLVSDGKTCYVIRNGRPEMGKITGTGCQLSGMMTAYVTACLCDGTGRRNRVEPDAGGRWKRYIP